ncbi:MAG TPA: ferritin-like protein [Candidatus Acidoferrales bacterium]|nr:ferritin-like protein [Candidatus Acidoferrales bacterium]
MNQTIAQLMQDTIRDPPWLQKALQSAVELELSTLPPYLCGYWALKDSTSYPATQINNIFFQEMLHFGLACNMLAATGKKPEVIKGYGTIEYPGPLPGGVVPACDGDLIPCDPNFKVMLGFPDFHAFAWMCAQIEYPEDPVPRPAAALAEETFATIGQFYDAVAQAFHDNTDKIPYDTSNQHKGPLKLFLVDSLDKAIAAIQLIQQQGEGGSKNPFSAPNQLSHFYAFGEIYYGHKYVFNTAKGSGDWTGDPVTITDADVYPITPVPAGGYTSPPAEVVDFDRSFTQMLTDLDEAWAPGGAAKLSAAIGVMPDLTDKAVTLLGKQMARPGGGIYGPQFRINTSAPEGGGTGGGGTMPVSFDKEIKPLFRTIDINHMKPMGVLLSDYGYMSDPSNDHGNAQAVLDVLKDQEMPPGGPFWGQDKLDLFAKWMSDGYKP